MTHLCYTLDEAAERLTLSETVLVRLSQYFKVPRVAYDETGYLSFKGDLAFSEQDLSFFRQVKERLLAGESLEEVKSRMRPDTVSSASTTAPVSPTAVLPWVEEASPGAPEAGMHEIRDTKPYEKAAEQSFERYKSMHRPGLSRVFENLLKEVSPAAAEAQKAVSPKRNPHAKKPGLGGIRLQIKKTRTVKDAPSPTQAGAQPPSAGQRTRGEQLQAQALLPFSAPQGLGVESPTASRGVASAGTEDELSWSSMIEQAVHHPRVLNPHLKNTARVLREQMTGDSHFV